MKSIQNGLSNMKTTETWKNEWKPISKVRFEFNIECDYYIKAMKLVKIATPFESNLLSCCESNQYEWNIWYQWHSMNCC